MNLFVERDTKANDIVDVKGGDSSNKYVTAAVIIAIVLIISYMVVNSSGFMPMPERDDLIQQFSVSDEFRKIHRRQIELSN